MEPRLSAPQRAYMNDPLGFEQKMRARAEELWNDGYEVCPEGTVGLFRVMTPQGAEYIVDALQEDCTCPYRQKTEVPQVPCKHLLGLSGLVEATLAFLKQFGLYGLPRLREERLREYRLLFQHWESTRWESACREAEEADYGQTALEADRAEREVREGGFLEY